MFYKFILVLYLKILYLVGKTKHRIVPLGVDTGILSRCDLFPDVDTRILVRGLPRILVYSEVYSVMIGLCAPYRGY